MLEEKDEVDEGGGGMVVTGGGAEEGGQWWQDTGDRACGSEMGGPAAESALYSIQRTINTLVSDILE